jgi:hypothetical protein
MDMEERTESYGNQNELIRMASILARYPQFLFVPDMHMPLVLDQRVSTFAIPKQNGTDYAYLQTLAERCGFVFYVRPGLVPNSNLAYFGPSGQPDGVALAFPPPALSVNMGPQTNVDSINFSYDGLAFEQVQTTRSESLANVKVPVMSAPISTDPPQALLPPIAYQQGIYRKVRADQPLSGAARPGQNAREHPVPDGTLLPMAMARAQARTNASSQQVVTVSGELDGLRYGAVLHARSMVDLRGVGATFDGCYYVVQSVTHSISKGQYKQSFSLKRSGVFPLCPMVRV